MLDILGFGLLQVPGSGSAKSAKLHTPAYESVEDYDPVFRMYCPAIRPGRHDEISGSGHIETPDRVNHQVHFQLFRTRLPEFELPSGVTAQRDPPLGELGRLLLSEWVANVRS